MGKKKSMIILIFVIIIIVAIIAGVIIYKNSTYSLEKVKSLLNSGKETENMKITEEVSSENGNYENQTYEQYIKDNYIYSITKNSDSEVIGKVLYNKENSELITILDNQKQITVNNNNLDENDKNTKVLKDESFMTLINSNAGADYEYCGKEEINGKECIKVSLLNKNVVEKVEKEYYYIDLEDNHIVKNEIYEGTDENNLKKTDEITYTYSYDTVKDEDILKFDRADYPDYEYFDNRTNQ